MTDGARPLKIGILCYPTFGGSGAVATELGRALARRGHEIHFLSYSRPFRIADDFHENIVYHEISSEQYPLFLGHLYTISTAVKIQQVVLDAGLDILHLHYALPHAISAMLAMKMLPEERRVPVVTTLHGTDITIVGSKPSFFPAVKLGLRESDALTCVSHWLKTRTCEEFDVCRDRRGMPEVIYNSVDPGVFKPREAATCKRRHFAAPDEKILMHISNFRPVKRTVEIVEVFAKVREKIKARLVMIGDGPDLELAVQRAKQLGVLGSMKIMGSQSGVEHFLPCADAFMYASESESFGLAALEAMACGVPVVGTRAGGLVEVVEEGVSGYLRPIGDVAGMAEAAVAMLGDEARLAAMGVAARKRAVDNFAASIIVPQYEDLYRRVLAGFNAGKSTD